MQNSYVLFNEITEAEKTIGQITLNRPEALNALTHEMILQMSQQLDIWAKAKHIDAVRICSNSDRAFCAGGDIRKAYEARAAAIAFFRDEYKLNTQIHDYPKPYIAFLDGLTMGGGVGISLHGSLRIATERFIFAMPETGIGFFPDIGGTYLLSRCPGQIGCYLGLTGARLSAEEALYIGLIDEVTSGKAKPIPHQADIDHCFSGETVEAILDNLQHGKTKWHQQTAEILLTKSPTSLKITLEAIRRATKLSFHACMQMEYGLSQHFLNGHDFYEGIRAQIIDKDKSPRWKPQTVQQISSTIVDDYFRPS